MFYEYSEQDNLIIKYLPLVKKVVSRIEPKNSDFDVDDLISIGVIGLMDAIKKYDYKKKVPFEAYATLRIRGNVIDELRKSGRVSRDRIAKLNQYYKAKENLENRLMRTPEESEICEELGINHKELYKLHETVHYLANVSLDTTIFSKDGNDVELVDILKDHRAITPEEEFINKERKDILISAIDRLNEREKIILNLYYVEELSLKEIAYILEVSTPRVSQIHGKILLKLRELISPVLEEQ